MSSRDKCFLIWYMAQGYPVAGGHEAHILNYATEIRKHGFDVRVVIPDPSPKHEHRFLHSLRERGIRIESVADSVAWWVNTFFCFALIPWLIKQICAGNRWAVTYFYKYVQARIVAVRLRRKIEAERPDIIHIFGRLADNLWHVLPVERVVFHHATEGMRDASWNDEEVKHFRVFCEKAAKNFAPGSGVVENVKREFGIKREMDVIFTMCPDENTGDISHRGTEFTETEKLEISNLELRVEGCLHVSGLRFQPSGCSREPSAISQRRATHLRFGVLCRFTEEKGIIYILEALKMYRDKYGDVDFTFAGTGELEYMIKDYISANHLDNVRIIRVATPYDVLKEIDVFVHPSVTDAMPMAIAEALMCGLPCIVTRVGGMPDLARDGVEGFLVEPSRSDLICESMERFSRMPIEELQMFRINARKRYEEKCAPESVVKIILMHYGDILHQL